jgi:hypothetical protein
VFTPSATLTSFKVWATITVAIELVSWLVIAFSAWLRVGELTLADVQRTPGGEAAVTSPVPSADHPWESTAGHAEGDRLISHTSAPPAPAPPAGWYPDPEDGSRSRWWDGRAWTEHLAPAAPPWPPPSQSF